MTAPNVVAAVTPVADALDALGVPYYLAGSVISSLHGVARATADVDVVAALRPPHAAALAERLADEYYADADAIADAIRRRAMFNVIHLATMMKVDVYLAFTAFDRSALSRHRLDSLLGTPDARQFSVATAEDVILHKLSWFRDGGGVSERLDVTELFERALLEASR